MTPAIITVLFLIGFSFYQKKYFSKTINFLESKSDQQKKELEYKYNLKIQSKVEEIIILDEAKKELESQLRLSKNQISVLTDRVPNFYSAVEKSLDKVHKRLDNFVSRINEGTVELVDSLSDEKKLTVYKYYISSFSKTHENQKMMSYEDFLSKDNIKITDHGKDWKKMGFAQKLTANYTGIYYWYSRTKDILI